MCHFDESSIRELRHLSQIFHHAPPGRVIEIAGWLIAHDQFRLMHQSVDARRIREEDGGSQVTIHADPCSCRRTQSSASRSALKNA